MHMIKNISSSTFNLMFLLLIKAQRKIFRLKIPSTSFGKRLVALLLMNFKLKNYWRETIKNQSTEKVRAG